MKNSSRGTWFIFVTFIVAMIMTLFPLPDSWQAFRPSWVMLVLSYWIIALPERIGMLWAFVCGLLLDAILNTSLGLHGFSLAIVTFILHILYKRVRLFPLWKQGLFMFFLSLVYLAMTFWLGRLTGKSVGTIAWQATIVNAILWPWIYALLRQLTSYFKVE